tara:strand:- start:6390 stop:7031 length:642 start_codon:yes stop_codon:yes gene_type:complete
MSFSTQDFHTLLDDKHTVISMATNSLGDGEYMIVMNGFVRPQSPLKEKYLNPHRNMSHIPPQYVRECPRCGGQWKALSYKIQQGKMENTHYCCDDSNCGVSICSLTFDKFARNHTPEAIEQLIAEQDAQDIQDKRMTEEDIIFSEFEFDMHDEIANLIDADENVLIPSLESDSMARAAEEEITFDMDDFDMSESPDIESDVTSQSNGHKNKED